MKRTKIVCTIGPATMDKEILKKMMLAGMNVGRFNFSHGSFEDQEKFFTAHYNRGYFDYGKDGFGELIKDEDDIVNKIIFYIKVIILL